MEERYVGKRITQLLSRRGWTLYRLAKESSVSYSTLKNILCHNNATSVSTLRRVCDGFGITLSEFFDGDATVQKKLAASDRQMLADFQRLQRDGKSLVTAYIQGLLRNAPACGAGDGAQSDVPEPQ